MADEEPSKAPDEGSEESTEEENPSQSFKDVNEANKVAERLEKANAEEAANLKLRQQLVERQEKANVQAELGGRSQAGTVKKKDERTEDQKNVEMAEKISRGEINPFAEDKK